MVTDNNYGRITFPKPDETHIRNFANALVANNIDNFRINGIIGLPQNNTSLARWQITRPGTVYAKMTEQQSPKGLLMDTCPILRFRLGRSPFSPL